MTATLLLLPFLGFALWGRPERETRTPVNMGNQPHRDNGEGVAFGPPLYPLLNIDYAAPSVRICAE